MKKLIFFLTVLISMLISNTVSAFLIEYDNKTIDYTGSVYQLQVNSKPVSLPLEPIIFNDRALVPVREVFEALGAKVQYNQSLQCVDISYSGSTISLFINQPTALINGSPVNITDNAVPKLINKPGEPAKTMVPARFISENIGLGVLFNDPVINITSTPVLSGKASIGNVEFYDSGNNTLTAHFKYNGTPGNVSGFILNDPPRLAVDIANCEYTTPSSYGVNINGVSKIRLGFENGRTRLVFDVNNIASAHVRVKNSMVTVTIGTVGQSTSKVTTEFENSQELPVRPNLNKPEVPQTPVVTPVPNPNPGQKIIVIDAGHGGKDGGAQGTLDGNTVLEKNLCLQIASRTRDILTANGYNVRMTRETDVYPSLQERADFANAMNAAIFVSIHINSADSAPTASGTEVFYAPLNNDLSYGVRSSDVAKMILDNLISSLGSRNRGVKESNHLVTRSSLMPAALVEVGFISNEQELRNMTSPEYQQLAAQSVANGIMSALNGISVPANTQELMEARLRALEEWENS